MKKYLTILSILTTSFAFGARDYSGQDFSHEFFINEDFSYVNFTNANLSSTSFWAVDFKGAVFTNANLSYAEFTEVDVTGVDFTGTNLTSTYFNYMNGFTEAQLRSASSVKGITLWSHTMENWDFSKLDLTLANFGYGEVNGANFANAKLTSVTFDNMDVTGANFEGADLRNAKFHNTLDTIFTVLTNANFTNADLRGTEFDDNVNKDDAIYKNTIMTDGTIENLSFTSADDQLTIRKYDDISVKITEDSLLVDGSIVIEDGAFLEIGDNVTITLTDEFEFIVSDNVSDVSDVLLMGENTTIVMAGCTDEEAISTFANLFKSEDGSTIQLTISESFVIIGSISVPEPAEWAMIFGALALGVAVYRKRK